MPVYLPDFESLRSRAKLVGFREPYDGETEADFRASFAEWTRKKGDHVEANEIETKKGWDEQSPEESRAGVVNMLGGEDAFRELMNGLLASTSKAEGTMPRTERSCTEGNESFRLDDDDQMVTVFVDKAVVMPGNPEKTLDPSLQHTKVEVKTRRPGTIEITLDRLGNIVRAEARTFDLSNGKETEDATTS